MSEVKAKIAIREYIIIGLLVAIFAVYGVLYLTLIKQVLTVGVYVQSSTPHSERICLSDGEGNLTCSDYHTGTGNIEWLEVSRKAYIQDLNFSIVYEGDLQGIRSGISIRTNK